MLAGKSNVRKTAVSDLIVALFLADPDSREEKRKGAPHLPAQSWVH